MVKFIWQSRENNGLEIKEGKEPIMKIFSAHFVLNREVYYFGGLNSRVVANRTMAYLKEFATEKNVWENRVGFIGAMKKTVRKLTGEPVVPMPWVGNSDRIIRLKLCYVVCSASGNSKGPISKV